MPELPDLEAYSKNLEKAAAGRTVQKVAVYRSEKLNVGSGEINSALTSSRISAFRRDGKEMLILFDNGQVVGIHLMLEGKFHVVSDLGTVDFKIIAIDFGSRFLVVSDPTGWAKMTLAPEGSATPDALSPDFNLAYFLKKLKEKKTKNIKAFLIDQNIVRGIGNAYADEILWEAKVSPESKAGRLPNDVARRLFEAVGTVLRRSVREILEVNPDVLNGEIRGFMRVHRKDRAVCPNGFRIRTKKIASKTTYYTEEQAVFS